MTELQNIHSKTKNISINGKIQDYLSTDILNVEEKRTLFRLRNRTEDIKYNYKIYYKNNLTCSLKCGDQNVEDIRHILNCDQIVYKAWTSRKKIN